jgi:hypothetical protein
VVAIRLCVCRNVIARVRSTNDGVNVSCPPHENRSIRGASRSPLDAVFHDPCPESSRKCIIIVRGPPQAPGLTLITILLGSGDALALG